MTEHELMDALRQLYAACDDELLKTHERSLPFADAVLRNRWQRAERLGFDDSVSLYDSAMVFGDVTVGQHTWIGPGVILDGTGGGLTIGAYCSISAGVHIYTHDTVLWALSEGGAPKRMARVEIGDCCHIGAQSVILPGIVIGRRCVVAANSVVNGTVADGTIVGGTPARRLGRVEEEGNAVRLVMDPKCGDAGD